MRVGLLLDDSLDRPDGVQQYVLGLGNELTNKGHIVYYLAGETRANIKNLHSLSKTLRVNFNGNQLRTPLPANKDEIRTLLNKLKLDIVHVQMPYSPLLAGRVINIASKQSVVVGTLHIFPNSWVEYVANKALTIINSKSLKKINKIVAVSKLARDTSGMKNLIEIIPNHINLSKYKPMIHADKNKIIFLGRLVPRKGCMVLLEALNILNKQGRLSASVTCEIAGEGPLKQQLIEYSKNNKLNKIVSFAGFISEKNKPDFISSAKIAIFPSTGGESFGIVLLESMASGVVTLASNIPAYKSVLNNNKACLFTSEDANDLANKIELILSSTKLRTNIIKEQNILVKKYDVKNVTTQIEKLYKDALSSARNM